MRFLNYKIGTDKQPKRILVISDLHVAEEKDILKLKRIWNILEEKSGIYDAIIVDGDILDATNVLRENEKVSMELLFFMKRLGFIAPTYVTYASHDMAYYDAKTSFNQHWIPDSEIFKANFLDKLVGAYRINIGSNQTYSMGEGYTISLVDPALDYAMLQPDGDSEVFLSEVEDCGFLNNLNANNTNILVCHYHNFILGLQKLGYLKNVDLGIAGHDHSGCTQIWPVEQFLNMIGLKNYGFISPGKKINFDYTKYSRGFVELDDRTKMIINPAITTLAHSAGILHKLNPLFYEGASDIEFVAEEDLERKRKK